MAKLQEGKQHTSPPPLPSGMQTYLHGPLDFAKTLKLRFRVGDLDLPERAKRYTSSREEKEVDAQMGLCGKVIRCRTHTVGECETYKKELDVLEEEMRKLGERDVEEFGTLDTRVKAITILGDRLAITHICLKRKQRKELPAVGGVSSRSRKCA